MNAHFVCVKVDREERPDVDAIYMDAVQAMTGHGGWPSTRSSTPEQVPFHAGTYFPPAGRQGLPGWSSCWRRSSTPGRQRREEIEQQGERIIDAGQAWPMSRSRSVNHGTDASNALPPAIRSNSIARSSSPRSSSWPTTPDSPRSAASTAYVVHVPDQREVGVVRGGRAREVAALLDQHLVGAELGGELLGEPLARVDLVELDVAERVARHVLARRLHRGDDLARRRRPRR